MVLTWQLRNYYNVIETVFSGCFCDSVIIKLFAQWHKSMHTQRWQFNLNKLIGLRKLFPVAVVLVSLATSLPATAQVISSERTVFGGAEQVPSNSQIIYSDQVSGFRSGYVNPGYYPNSNYYPYPSRVIRRNFPTQQPVIVAPPNGSVYQVPGGNTVIYKSPFPGSPFGYNNPRYYSNPNYYPYPNPFNRRNPASGQVLINPTIRNSTLINPVIIAPGSRWQREGRFNQPARY